MFVLFVLILEMALVVPIAVYAVAPGRAGRRAGPREAVAGDDTRAIPIVLLAAFGIVITDLPG